MPPVKPLFVLENFAESPRGLPGASSLPTVNPSLLCNRCSLRIYFYIQLTLERHGFELPQSTGRWIFFLRIHTFHTHGFNQLSMANRNRLSDGSGLGPAFEFMLQEDLHLVQP